MNETHTELISTSSIRNHVKSSNSKTMFTRHYCSNYSTRSKLSESAVNVGNTSSRNEYQAARVKHIKLYIA